MSLTEKYRPRKIEELIGQDEVKIRVKSIIEKYIKGELLAIPPMLFYGKQGTGKTTTAYVIYHELRNAGIDISILEFNASKERGVKFVEERIAPLIRMAGKRIILLDEADYMSPNAQGMLRRLIEEAEQIALRSNGRNMTTFILTCNYLSRIIEPIRSRTIMMAFKPIPDEAILNRLLEIAENEAREGNIRLETEKDYELLADALTIIVRNSRGDLRQAIRMFETILLASRGGKITPELVKTTIQPELPVQIFRTVFYNGDIIKARNMLYTGLIEGKFTEYEFLERVVDEIMNFIELNADRLGDGEKMALALLLREVKDAERNIVMGCSSAIQLLSLLASVLAVRSKIRMDIMKKP